MIGTRTRLALVLCLSPEYEQVLPRRHTHDCECCVLVGRADCSGHSGVKHDVYLCGEGERGTLVARYGQDGDYASFPVALAEQVAAAGPGIWADFHSLYVAWVAARQALVS